MHNINTTETKFVPLFSDVKMQSFIAWYCMWTLHLKPIKCVPNLGCIPLHKTNTTWTKISLFCLTWRCSLSSHYIEFQLFILYALINMFVDSNFRMLPLIYRHYGNVSATNCFFSSNRMSVNLYCTSGSKSCINLIVFP